MRPSRPPLWRDVRVLRVAFQVAVLGGVAAIVLYLWGNLITNLRDQNLPTGYGFLDQPAGFRITGSSFSASDTVREAIWVGFKNTLAVSGVGIVLATVVGVFVGIARLSSNRLVAGAAATFVETIRNIPVLVVILFWSTAVILKLPRISEAIEWGDTVILSNRGLWVPSVVAGPGAGTLFVVLGLGAVAAVGVGWWRTRLNQRTGRPHHRLLFGTGVFAAVAVGGFVALSGPLSVSLPEVQGFGVDGGVRMLPEYAALLAGLVVYTASHIAEIVRGSVLSVPRGQTDAARAVGLTGYQRMRFVVLPQAFRIAVPPIANQYLNLTKNSSLAVAIGYAELMTVTQIVIGNANPAPQSIAILMAIYLSISLAIAAVTNLVNRRLQVAGVG